MKRSNSSVKKFMSLTGFSMFEKVIAFVYQAVLAAILGAGLTTDSYNSASQLFDLIDTTVLGAIVVSVIHRFTSISKQKSEEEAFSFLSNVNTTLTIFMSIIAAVVFVLAKPISYLIAPGFEAAGRPSLILCIRILCLLPPIMVTATVRQALLRQKKCFIAVNCRSLCISVFGMAVLIFFSRNHKDNASILCIGYIISNLAFALILHFRGKKFGTVKFAKPIFDDELKTLLILTIPTVISKGIVRLSLLVDQIIASTVGTGAISYLGYAQSLYHIVNNLLIVNLCMILLTDFTNLAVKNDFDGMKLKIKKSISSILLLLAPVTILTVMYSDNIVKIAYQRGAFGADSTKIVATLLLLYALGFVPSLMNSVYTQVLYSFGKTKQAMVNTLISLGLNIVFSIGFSRLIGIGGIALGTSASQLIASFTYRISVKKCLPDYKLAVDLKYIFKLIIALIPGAVCAFFIKEMINSAILSFALATVVTFILLFAVLIILKEENTLEYYDVLFGKLKGKLKNGKQ